MPPSPVERLREAATALVQTANLSSPLPWSYYEDHGRDPSDEGWSHIGILDADGEHVGLTHAPGYEGNDQPEQDAALTVLLAAAAKPLGDALATCANRFENGTDGVLDKTLLAVADAVLGRGVRA